MTTWEIRSEKGTSLGTYASLRPETAFVLLMGSRVDRLVRSEMQAERVSERLCRIVYDGEIYTIQPKSSRTRQA
jgi:hypothetical protein